MKYIVVIGDGMVDQPLKELDGETPLQRAETPNMDFIAKNGSCGMLATVPQGMEPGSDVANLSIMGYDPKKYYTGRGPLEAASIGAQLKEDDVAFRCNLITQENGLLADFNAGHISTAEASQLIESLNQSFFRYGKFYLGTSYRHLFIYKGKDAALLKSTPPHDVVGEPIQEYLLKGDNSVLDALSVKLNELMYKSSDVLEKQPINEKRVESDKNPANMIWLWGQGPKPQLPPFKEKYNLKGATITGVDLIKGIGTYLGLTNVHVPGATGFYDTDYCGKAKYALESLEDHDLVFIHVEAPDEAGHAGDIREKIMAIERIDRRILGKLREELHSLDDYALAVLPDHPTPIDIRTHTSDPVPYAVYTPGCEADKTEAYNEVSVLDSFKDSSNEIMEGYKFLKFFIEYARRGKTV
ncbi:cofactor-independent phosphoglycerate mutase [Methanobacterium sp.]|uniref:cofactor-independent phosphoglycerate mutase n=1 Tax=Methanobacterium sp. TaxID=2164 RepID=UPI0025F24A3E|nr:cofactor-independent phosphoglycerate mutase [Methanobacterium sp.]MBI5460388.1 cofactor-independent phosphoglycerate mutase [Methanobacterium sp.]